MSDNPLIVNTPPLPLKVELLEGISCLPANLIEKFIEMNFPKND